jgi:hypothetical protein
MLVTCIRSNLLYFVSIAKDVIYPLYSFKFTSANTLSGIAFMNSQPMLAILACPYCCLKILNVTAYNKSSISYSLNISQNMMHVAVAPCDQTAIVAGASSGNLLYFQIMLTNITLSLLQNLNPAYSSAPNGVTYL